MRTRASFLVVACAALIGAISISLTVGHQNQTAPGVFASENCQNDDPLEPNDTKITASVVSLPYEADLRSCNDDWIRFHVGSATKLRIDALFTHADGNIEVDLYVAGGTAVYNARSADDDEHISYNVPAAGDYVIVVYPFAVPIGFKGNDYHLTIQEGPEPTPTATPPQKPIGDVNDDGSTDSIDAALVLQLGAGLVTSLANEASADANGSGGIDSIDAALILQYVAGLVDSLPP